jgi:hypothetical protein
MWAGQSNLANLNDHFEQGADEMMRLAQAQANKFGRSIKIKGGWVNPSSAALAKRNTGHDPLIQDRLSKGSKPPRLD